MEQQFITGIQLSDIIMRDIVESIKLYLPLSSGIGIISCFIFLIISRMRKYMFSRALHTDWKSVIVLFLVVTYFSMLISITLLSRAPGSRAGLELTLFSTFTQNRGIVYPIENIILFIPLGLLLPLIGSRLTRLTYCMVIGGAISCLIELTQFLTKRGYSQVDDLMTNVLGVILGYVGWKMIHRIRNRI